MTDFQIKKIVEEIYEFVKPPKINFGGAMAVLSHPYNYVLSNHTKIPY